MTRSSSTKSRPSVQRGERRRGGAEDGGSVDWPSAETVPSTHHQGRLAGEIDRWSLGVGGHCGPPLYLLVRSPIDDDADFARRLRQDKVLLLPGRTVDLPGFFRISLTATDAMIDRALPVFAAAMREARRPAAS